MTLLTQENGGIQFFQLVRVAHALASEIKTGMKFGHGSIMKLAASYCGSPKRTKLGVLKDYVTFLGSVYPDWEPSRTMVDVIVTPTLIKLPTETLIKRHAKALTAHPKPAYVADVILVQIRVRADAGDPVAIEWVNSRKS